MKVLILVDIQNDFLPGGSLAVPEGDQIIPIVNKIQTRFDLVVATQDWHPKDHKSFASNHKEKEPFESIELNGLQQTLWPDHCIQGSQGAEISQALSMDQTEAIFRKGTNREIDSYSGFYDNGHLKSTGLSDYLRGKGIRQVFLTGLAGDFCIFYTGLDSLTEGFETFIVEDGVRPIYHENFTKAMDQFRVKGGKMLRSASIL